MPQSSNPTTGKPLQRYKPHRLAQAIRAVRQAHIAYTAWAQIPFSERSVHFRTAAALLRERKEAYAELMALEMGKPIIDGESEVEKCAWVCEFYADHAERMLAHEVVETDAHKSYIRYDPLGVILAIMPWNFPFWQVFRAAAQALMAGNTIVLKHASNVPGCAIAMAKLFRDAGFPRGVFTMLLIPSTVAEQLIALPEIQGVTLTGSDAAGSRVASIAGSHLKKTVLELGGSDPFIVLEDADIHAVAAQACQARMRNAGQSCIAAKRFIVSKSIAQQFTAALTIAMNALVVGDPLSRNTQVGPLAREDLLKRIDQQVKRSVRSGAKCLLGGKRLDRRGFFYAPTVLTNVRPGMPAFDEELFGPVAAIITPHNAAETIRLANASPYGLGASIWTADPEKAEAMAAQLNVGTVAINSIVKSDPRLPFGGVKRSGYGRELGSQGIREFVNVKTVWVH